MILKNNDEIKDIDSEHINNSKDIKDEIKLLEKCREIFNQLSDGTKSLLSKYEAELQSIDGYKQQIDVARIIHKSLSEQKNKGLNTIYRDISFEDKALIDSSLKEIRSVKDSFLKIYSRSIY